MLHADLNAIYQIRFPGNLEQAGNTMFFLIEEAKETTLDFCKEALKYYKFILL